MSDIINPPAAATAGLPQRNKKWHLKWVIPVTLVVVTAVIAVSIVVLKQDSPTVVWEVSVTGDPSDTFDDVAVAADGSVYTVGFTRRPASSPIPDKTVALVGKWSSVGDLLWERRDYGGDNWYDFSFLSATTTSDGNLIAVGSADTGTAKQAVVYCLAPNGDVVWSATIGEGRDNEFDGVAVAEDGNVVAVGHLDHGADGGDPGTGVVAKFGVDGVMMWTTAFRGLAGSSWDSLPDFNYIVWNAVAVADDGRIFVAGVDVQNRQSLIASFSVDGNLIWAESLSESYSLDSVALTADGNLIVGGGGGPAIACYTAGGDLVWVRTQAQKPGDWGPTSFKDAAITPSGEIVFIGACNAYALCDDAGALIVTVKPDGVITGTKTMGQGTSSYFSGVAMSLNGDVIVAGCLRHSNHSCSLIAALRIT